MAKNSITEQMELFEDGGFKDQGKTKDPVSKNPVPVGSTQEEVRDDIPAQLSEGEFVLPADVVRYHGLEKIMGIRDQAKQGLQRMENMGQMGNSDQATIPDGVPFKQMAEGGVVPGVNIQGPTTQLTKQSMFAKPAQVQPQQVAQPVTVQTPQAPVYASSQVKPKTPYTFEQAIGTPFGQQQQSETRVYVNDAGEKLYIPFVNGQPIYPVPAGYTPEPVAEKEKEQEQTVTDVRSRTTRDDGGDDNVGIQSTAVSDMARASQKTDSGLFGKIATGIGAIVNPIATVGGIALSNILDDKKGAGPSFQSLDDEAADIAGAGAADMGIDGRTRRAFTMQEFNPSSGKMEDYVINDYESAKKTYGLTGENEGISFKFGKEAGDVDATTNHVYSKFGLALMPNGSAATTAQGTVSYKSAEDFGKHMSASFDTGWFGSAVSSAEYAQLGQKGKERYDAWASKLGYKTGGGSDGYISQSVSNIVNSSTYDRQYAITGTRSVGKVDDGSRTPITKTKTDIGTSLKGLDSGAINDSKTTTNRVGTVDPTEFAKGKVGTTGSFSIGRDPKLAAGITSRGDRSTPLTLSRLLKESPAGRLFDSDLEKAEQTYADQKAQVEADIKSGKANTSIPAGPPESPRTSSYSYDYYQDNDSDNNSSGGSDPGSSSSSDMGFSTASGGFIKRKNLPKANKKKRGGLASRR